MIISQATALNPIDVTFPSKSVLGYEGWFEGGQSASAPPPGSDVDLLGYRKRVVDLDTEVSDRALNFRMA